MNTKVPQSKQKVVHQFIFVEVPSELVVGELMAWDKSSWWPKKCAIKHVRKASAIELGITYQGKISGLLGPSWEAEVTKFVSGRRIEYTFRRGALKGYESISIDWRYNGTRIDYELHYEINGIHNQILWIFLYEKTFSANMKMILEAFKKHVVQLYQQQQEKGLEGQG